MNDFIKAMEKLPFIVKLILCIPVLDIIWSIWKLCKGTACNAYGQSGKGC